MSVVPLPASIQQYADQIGLKWPMGCVLLQADVPQWLVMEPQHKKRRHHFYVWQDHYGDPQRDYGTLAIWLLALCRAYLGETRDAVFSDTGNRGNTHPQESFWIDKLVDVWCFDVLAAKLPKIGAQIIQALVADNVSHWGPGLISDPDGTQMLLMDAATILAVGERSSIQHRCSQVLPAGHYQQLLQDLTMRVEMYQLGFPVKPVAQHLRDVPELSEARDDATTQLLEKVRELFELLDRPVLPALVSERGRCYWRFVGPRPV